ncbi:MULTISPECIES: hypothetical protein, partial [Lactococcus]
MVSSRRLKNSPTPVVPHNLKHSELNRLQLIMISSLVLPINIYLFIYLSIYLFIYLSIYLFIYLSIYLF